MMQSDSSNVAGPAQWLRWIWGSVEFKLVLAWLLVVGSTIFLDSGGTYLKNPGSSAELILRQTVLLGFFALGSAVIIISGGIDLSSGSVIAMSATVFGSLLLVLDPTGLLRARLRSGRSSQPLPGRCYPEPWSERCTHG